jgi:hypothetical protein
MGCLAITNRFRRSYGISAELSGKSPDLVYINILLRYKKLCTCFIALTEFMSKQYYKNLKAKGYKFGHVKWAVNTQNVTVIKQRFA